MDLRQLEKYSEVLKKYEHGDQFITPKRTRSLTGSIFEGVKTKRDILKIAEDKLGINKDDISNTRSSNFDRVLYDTALARKSPMHKWMIDSIKAQEIESQSLYVETRDIMLDLHKKALDSRKQRFLNRIVPQQKILMNFIESTGTDRAKAAAKMTEAEMKLAEFIQGFYMKAYDYLKVSEDIGSSRFKGKYVMHAKKPLSELLVGVKDTGLKNSIKELWRRGREDATNFETRTDTGESLGLRKFFKNTLFRKGESTPSQNVVRSTDIYMKQLFKKIALDRTIPAIDTLAQALSKDHIIGQETDSKNSLHKFVKEYINNKKGQRLDLKYKQGGVLDTTLKGLNTLLSLRYIALNIPLQLSALGGETMAKIPALGLRKLGKAQIRRRSKQGKSIIKKYKSYVGDTVLDGLMQANKTMGEKSGELLYGVLQWNRRQTNIDILLGNMTDKEFKDGEISNEKLAEITRLAGRWLSIEGSNSLIGSTTAGKSFTKFRTWAIPIIHSVADLAASTAKTLTKQGDPDRRLSKEQKTELYRLAEAGIISTMLVSALSALGGEEVEEDTFTNKLRQYAIRDINTITQSMSVQTMLSTGVTASYLARLAVNIDHLTTLSGEDAAKQRKRGLKGMERLFKPAAISMLQTKVLTRAETRRNLAAELKRLKIAKKSVKVVIEKVREYNKGKDKKAQLTFKSVRNLAKKEKK